MTTSAPSSAPTSVPRIGVFDSGLGGLSVLRSIRQQLPAAQLLYVADSGHAPYGERGDDYVCARSLAIAEFLYQQGAQLLVIACNTARRLQRPHCAHAIRTGASSASSRA